MTRLEKALYNLEGMGIDANINSDTIYVHIQDTELELSEFEINYQAQCYDDSIEENEK